MVAGSLWLSLAKADTPVVVHVENILHVEAKGSVVEVSIGEPKAREIAHKSKKIPIVLSLPLAAANNVFMCETRVGPHSATLSFKFSKESSANDFAEELNAAKKKSECNCQDH